MDNSVRTELENVVNIKQGNTEDIYEYTVRLAVTVDNEISDVAFNALSKDAQTWMNNAITAYKNHTKLTSLPSTLVNDTLNTFAAVTGVVQPIVTTETPSLPPVTPTKAEVKKSVAKAFAADLGVLKAGRIVKPKKVKKTVEEKNPSSSSDIRDIICQNYNLPLSGISEILTEKSISFKPNLVRNVYAYVSATVKTMNNLGLLKNIYVKGSSESARLRELICANPAMTVAQVQDEVVKQGIGCNTATVSVMFYHTKAVVQSLKKLGMVE